MRDFFLSIPELRSRLGAPDAPLIFDVRRRPLFDSADTIIPTAFWRDHNAAEIWGARLPNDAEVVVHCVHGHNVSQAATATLRARGVNARVLKGGIEGWKESGGPIIHKVAIPNRDEDVSSVWVAPLEQPVAYIATAWLIRRFVDHGAEFRFVETEHVAAVAEELGAHALGIPESAFASDDNLGGLDVMLQRLGLIDVGVTKLAGIVGQPHTDNKMDEPETAGVRAILSGAARLSGQEPHAILERTLSIFDATYAYARSAGKAES